MKLMQYEKNAGALPGSGRWACPKSLKSLAALMLVLLLQGCSIIYKTTGDILVNFGRSEMTPYLLTYDDVDMACTTGTAFTPFLASFEQVHSNPERLVVLTYSMAAVCAQEQAMEQAMRYTRAVDQGRAGEARDARTQEKHHSRLAASRLYESHRRAVSAYGEPTENSCPRLRTDFDELVFMVGWLNGVQAMLYDGASNGSLGVPRDIAAKARHAANCLDSEKWWGVPRALRASVGVILPALAPEDADPWSQLDQAVQRGYDAGVRLSSALYVMAAYSVDDRERIREGIRGFARNNEELDENYAMLDAIARFTVKGVSDRLWTDAVGERTPFGELGSFWDDEEPGDDADIEDLL